MGHHQGFINSKSACIHRGIMQPLVEKRIFSELTMQEH